MQAGGVVQTHRDPRASDTNAVIADTILSMRTVRRTTMRWKDVRSWCQGSGRLCEAGFAES